jgi:Tfp pilus assembly protein PilO
MAAPKDLNKKIFDALQKVPIGLVFAAYVGYAAWDWYSYNNDAESPLIMRRVQLEADRKDIEVIQKKIKEATEFYKSLDQKRVELRKLAQQLDDLKGTINATIDVPGFMKLIATEAKKVGLNVLGIKPGEQKEAQYYAEQPFTFGFRGLYVQFMVFLDRLANFQTIARADSFKIHPIGAAGSRYVDLEGEIQIKAFRYLGTKADDIASGKSGAKAGGGSGP